MERLKYVYIVYDVGMGFGEMEMVKDCVKEVAVIFGIRDIIMLSD